MLPIDFVILSVALLILVISVTVFYAFRGGVPYVPTPVAVAQTMVRSAGLKGNERVYDLGAGNGRILIEAKRMYPSVSATGVELSPTVWLLGLLTIALARQRIRFLRADARTVDLRDADVVFLYLTPPFLGTIEDKLDRELRPGTVVISHAFPFPRRQPVQVTTLPWGAGKKTVLRYEW
jgi:predicted RNA methylase